MESEDKEHVNTTCIRKTAAENKLLPLCRAAAVWNISSLCKVTKKLQHYPQSLSFRTAALGGIFISRSAKDGTPVHFDTTLTGDRRKQARCLKTGTTGYIPGLSRKDTDREKNIYSSKRARTGLADRLPRYGHCLIS